MLCIHRCTDQSVTQYPRAFFIRYIIVTITQHSKIANGSDCLSCMYIYIPHTVNKNLLSGIRSTTYNNNKWRSALCRKLSANFDSFIESIHNN
jgi:hypothetical protein